MCPEGAPYSGAPYRIEIIRADLFILAPLSGRIFAWRLPRVQTLGWALLPFRGATLYPSLMLTRMGGRRTEATSSLCASEGSSLFLL